MTQHLERDAILPDPLPAVRDYWDAASQTYDQLHGHGLFGERQRQAWCRLLARLLGPERLRVIDVATGTGFVAFRLAELGHDVVGVDTSTAMLDVARRAAAKHSQRGNLEFRVGTAELAELTGAPFDAVASRHLLWTLPDPERTIGAWREMVRPGGAILAIDGLWFGNDPRTRILGGLGHALDWFTGAPKEHGGNLYRTNQSETFPLKAVRSHEPARNAFARAGLTNVRGEYLDGIDDVERSEMPLAGRLTNQWRRYLVEGTG
jgi:ubiquinone/menaquinone biosynthesis C-methylase UbiE